ncbi:acetyltransferase [Fulvivirga sedimenti]|uniref:Acetyltransferase n=1 Tax=Fulvivirga sedimenti TaxID=2879465 RepID=A0A9X1HLB1_9BACT|nr:acetyltransferase [Fulvivirga sedimenti]MCA6074001.1 acetyltransferase [Fulvivirga sedimenti]
MDKPVIILGANSLARAAKSIFESNDIVTYGFLDDEEKLIGTEIDNVVVLGKTTDDGFLKLIGKKCEAFVASDDNKVRKFMVNLLTEKRKMMPVNAIHRTAFIDPSVHLSHGTFINMNVHIGVNAKIGNHCILNSGVTLDHGVQLGDYVQVGAGSTINEGVTISDEAFIGSGVTIVSGVTIGKGARVGAGSVVISSVAAGKTVFGNPAAEINR